MRSRRPYGSSRHGVYERGATAVEFALIVPVFLALVFGTLELALTFQHQSVLNAAANTAAREPAASWPPIAHCRPSPLVSAFTTR